LFWLYQPSKRPSSAIPPKPGLDGLTRSQVQPNAS
jgi:hypothetical protein